MSEVTPSRRQLSEERKANALKRQGLPPAPTTTLIERDSAGSVVGVTPAGLALIERLARAGAPQNKIASALGLFHKQFRALLAAQRGEGPVRYAWERGYADAEQAMVNLLAKHARTSFVAAIYLSKARYGWTEEQKAGVSVTSNIVLTLPKPRSRAEHFAMMNQIDPRSLAGPTAMKDVTPETAALPAPESEAETETDTEKENDNGQPEA